MVSQWKKTFRLCTVTCRIQLGVAKFLLKEGSRAVGGKGNDVDQAVTLRLLDQTLDLVQYRESLDIAELGTLAARPLTKGFDREIAALKRMTLRHDQDGDAASVH